MNEVLKALDAANIPFGTKYAVITAIAIAAHAVKKDESNLYAETYGTVPLAKITQFAHEMRD